MKFAGYVAQTLTYQVRKFGSISFCRYSGGIVFWRSLHIRRPSQSQLAVAGRDRRVDAQWPASASEHVLNRLSASARLTTDH